MFSQMMSAINGPRDGKKPDKQTTPVQARPSVQRLSQDLSQDLSQEKGTAGVKPTSSFSNGGPVSGSKPASLSALQMKDQQAKVSRLKAERERERERERQRQAVRVSKHNSKESTETRSGRGSVSGAPSRMSVSSRASGSTVLHKNVSRINKGDTYTEPKKPAAKKLNFKDIMKQAESVDAEKLKYTVKVRDPKAVRSRTASASPDPEAKPRNHTRTNGVRTNGAPYNSVVSAASNSSASSSSSKVRSKVSRSPAPLAQPMPELADKSRRRKEMLAQKAARLGRSYDDEYEMDDFIDDEEDRPETGSRHLGYDRDEIWSIFNPGKKREFYNDFSDDDVMEATGEEIFGEETRSALVGRIEDQKEEERLRKLALQKKKKL